MLIRSVDDSVYNLHHIERFEIVTVALEDEIAKRAKGQTGAACEAYVLRAYINGVAYDLVGPSADRLDAEAGLNRIFNMVSERADLNR